MFKRDGQYYAGFGVCCCFCGAGSNVQIFRASQPMGPYGNPVQVATAQDWYGQTGAVWFTGQDYVLFGDRWQSAPDHIKAHDFSFMAPLKWDAAGNPQSFAGFQNWVEISY
jgi:hypothetical protein